MQLMPSEFWFNASACRGTFENFAALSRASSSNRSLLATLRHALITMRDRIARRVK
jgi:hypothetical protein